ncbi:hypothetical protein COLO4_37788 [Corchorus olitorius]|uniref:Nucleic acid-binding protein n=1 Tax=Corchorus olitorius TaxID=93759 RepID=A0A1R3FZA5_9ROSI|nr:hypothetical protein COLO4_37788 [Corchorus olitorius]
MWKKLLSLFIRIQATKIYIDIDIPEVGHVRERFEGKIMPGRLLREGDVGNAQPPIPQWIMQLNLLIADESGRIEVTMFGKLAEELVRIQLTRIVASQCLDENKLPLVGKDPSNDGTEYICILGVTDQIARRGFLRDVMKGKTIAASSPEHPQDKSLCVTIQTAEKQCQKREGTNPVETPDSPSNISLMKVLQRRARLILLKAMLLSDLVLVCTA